MPILRIRPTNVLTNIAAISTGFLDTVNDAVVGQPVANLLTGLSDHSAQLGNIIVLNSEQAAKRGAYPSTYPLYANTYMYVQFKSASSASNARGQVVFWDTLASGADQTFIVTPDVSATNVMTPAGIALNAVTKGYYGWVAIGPGLVICQYRASVTDTTIDDAVFVTQTPANTVDALAKATGSLTTQHLGTLLGIAYEAGANGALKVVWLY